MGGLRAGGGPVSGPADTPGANRPIRVAFDARDASDPTAGGWARYAASMLSALERRSDVEVVSHTGGPRRLPELAFEQLVLPARLWRTRPDLVHVPHPFLPLARPCAGVATVHDLAFEAYPEDFARLTGWKYRAFTRRAAAGAELVIVPSRATRDDLVARYGTDPERVRVVPLASPLERGGRPAEQVDVPSAPYALTVGELRGKKNLGRLVEAWGRAREQGLEHVLLVIGSGARAPRPGPGVSVLGRIDDTRLDALYRSADFLVYPSLLEGFGFTALEAMERGCPVALARGSSLPEVGGDAALYFDPLDVDEMADAILRLARDRELRLRLGEEGMRRAAEFSWERTAEQTVAVYREALAMRGRAPPRRRSGFRKMRQVR